MKKVISILAVSLAFVGLTGGAVDAKNCIGYCPGVSSDSGNPNGGYKPRNTYVNPYVKKNGQYVQGYTRSKPCKSWSC
jgi:hypothetical protein